MRRMMNILFSRVTLIALGASLLISCGGGSSSGGVATAPQQGTLNLAPQNFNVELGNSVVVPFQLVGSQGVVNQFVSFSVSDPAVAQVSPAHCVVSSGVDAGCMVTVTGLKQGPASLTASSQGYGDYSTSVTVITGTGVGTISVTQKTGTTYFTGSPSTNWSVTVNFQPTNNYVVPAGNPIYVLFKDPSGFIQAGIKGGVPPILQCGLTTNAPTCTVSGTWNPSSIPASSKYASGIPATIGITGSWQTTGQAFAKFNPIPVPFTPTNIQTPGTLSVTTQNASNQIYSGMKAPLFVQLNNSTLNNGNYNVTLSIPTASQSLVAFYDFTPGNNSPTGLVKSFTKTCNINFDNSGIGSPGNNGCGFGLVGLQQGAATISVALTQISATPSDKGLPPFNPVFNFNVDNVGSSPLPSRTITITNNSSKAVMFGANNGTSVAYNSSGNLLGKGNASCGYSTNTPTANSPTQQCPIGSTCIQGGATPSAATTFQCYWDQPVLPTSAILPTKSAQFTFSGYSGVTTGNQQIQWSGNFYALNCPDGTGANCPTLPTTPGTGAPNNAQTIAEVTFQHNTNDYYDVSIINGVSNSIQWGPDPASGKTSASGATPYFCGTAGSTVAQANSNYTLPKSTWLFNPALTNFPNGISPADGSSASSSYALVSPSVPASPTSCKTSVNTCSGADPVCGWNLPNVLKGGSGVSFAPTAKVCGAFQAWAAADQIWGWNSTTTGSNPNQAPFSLGTTFSATPSSVPAQTTVSVGDLQLCVNNTYSSYESPAPTYNNQNLSTNLACGGTNWPDITKPAIHVTTSNPNWLKYVYPTISWLKTACPTCYTYPFDDESSTFQCQAGVGKTGKNSLNYNITIGDIQNVF